jgi:hypothetical protein
LRQSADRNRQCTRTLGTWGHFLFARTVRMSGRGEKKKAKGRAPAHQNKFAFYHNKNSTKTVAITNMVRGRVHLLVGTGIISGTPCQHV